MQSDYDSTEKLSDANVTTLLKIAAEPPDALEELNSFAELSPGEIWEEIEQQWKRLGKTLSGDIAAKFFNVPVYRFDRWRRHKEIPSNVRRRAAALYELVALMACGKLNNISDRDLRAIVTMLRGLADSADDNTVRDVISLLGSQFGRSKQTPALPKGG
jgi:hypothetical protein